MKTDTFISSLVGIALVLPTGCASIVSGRNADVAFESYPSNAHVVIHDKQGRAVASLNTPGVATLKRNRPFFMPARYTATIAAPGYQPAQVPIRSTINPWILGNIAVGGIPGLVIDNTTGAAWKPRDAEIYQQLSPLYVPPPHLPYLPARTSQHISAGAAQRVADSSAQDAPLPDAGR